MKQVIIYSTPTCHFCQQAKEYFKANNVAYTEHDLSPAGDPTGQYRKELVDKSGQLGVPVILIDEEVVVGFDQERLATLLGLAA